MSALRTWLSPRKGRIFMPFSVIGDPDAATTLAVAGAYAEAGADVLEFGFPFSDPPADGPVIQAADQRALAAGMTPPAAFGVLDAVRARHGLPVVLLMYYNLMLQYGLDAFYARAAAAGVQGVLVADLPLEHADAAAAAARRHGIAPVFLATFLTPADRLARLAAAGDGFVYVVAQVGVTGERGALDAELPDLLGRLRALTDLPLLAGFGIADGDQARAALDAGADGVIVGSALVRQLAAGGVPAAAALAARIRAATL
ncbi:MAG: tryptophan synthase subunit alpha [bacterium]